jgi:hypothetical protein
MEVDVGLEAFGALVAVDTETEIIGTASPGEFVQIEGKFLPGTGLVRASQITTDDNSNGNLYDDWDDDSEAAEIELKGPIEDLSIAGGSGWIVVNGTLVHVTMQTDIEFDEEGEATTSALAVGQYVEVEGDLLPDGSVQAREIDIESGDENGASEEREEGDEGDDGDEDDDSDDGEEDDEGDESDDGEEDDEGNDGEDREGGEDPSP